MASGPPRSSPKYSSQRLKETNDGVTEIVDIMRVNMEKVIQRDEKLTDLDDRADALQVGARQFESTATRLKRKYWWQNLKMWILLIAIAIIVIIIIVVWVTTSQSS